MNRKEERRKAEREDKLSIVVANSNYNASQRRIFLRHKNNLFAFYQICKCYLAHKQITEENSIYMIIL